MKKLTILVFLSGIFNLTLLAQSDSSFFNPIIIEDSIVFYIEFDDTFCNGFKEGFEDGYCFDEYICNPPITPICPLLTINDTDNYKGGYKRGFIIGANRKKNGN